MHKTRHSRDLSVHTPHYSDIKIININNKYDCVRNRIHHNEYCASLVFRVSISNNSYNIMFVGRYIILYNMNVCSSSNNRLIIILNIALL